MPSSSDLPLPPSLRALREADPIALFLDFDGTLVDLAPTPDTILVPARLADRLATLAATLDGALALVSGRALIDLEHHSGPLAVARAGSHGIDRRYADGRALGSSPEPMPAAVHDLLARFAAEHGFRLEAKPHGGALHYRDDPGLEPAGLAFAADLAAEHALAVKRGKFVIELVQPGADKSGAVEAFMRLAPFAGRKPVFVGDDVTDEDGMRAADELGGFGIAVGERPSAAARYRLADPAAVLAWLGL